MTSSAFPVRGFNLCESLLRHSPEQLRTFVRRMKHLDLNSLIAHYDYGWRRYGSLLRQECAAAGVEITLMTFGPRTFFGYTDWNPRWFAKRPDGTAWTERLECETHPCRFEPDALEAFREGATKWLQALPPDIRRVHMRAADGLLFCQCPRCRVLPDHEKWQPFVDCFAETAACRRPDLLFESDVYVKRYHIPGNRTAFESMDRIMYDTFYRHPFYPLGSDADVMNAPLVKCAATEAQPDAATPNRYHLNRLMEWTEAFPGKVFIHENMMGQSLFGTFQHNTSILLRDQELFRSLNVAGVCYEAYEPGFSMFAESFETLAKGLAGKAPEAAPDKLAEILPQTAMNLFCNDPAFPLEEYIKDPFLLRQAELYRRFQCDLTPELFREYTSFAFAHAERMDPLMIGFGIAQAGLRFRKLRFTGLSPAANDLLHRRKLWDFMEELPDSVDPIAYCGALIEELTSAASRA